MITSGLTDLGNGYFAPTVFIYHDNELKIYHLQTAHYGRNQAAQLLDTLIEKLDKENMDSNKDWHLYEKVLLNLTDD